MSAKTAAPEQAPSPVRKNSPALRRTCECGTHTPGGGPCATCCSGSLPSEVQEVLGQSGTHLDTEIRTFMEERLPSSVRVPNSAPEFAGLTLGSTRDPQEHEADQLAERAMHSAHGNSKPDLSGVRIHMGGSAEAAARAVRARAFSVGSHIVFRSGEYNPASAEGKSLILHELAHMGQPGSLKTVRRKEGGGDTPTVDPKSLKIPDDMKAGKSSIPDRADKVPDVKIPELPKADSAMAKLKEAAATDVQKQAAKAVKKVEAAKPAEPDEKNEEKKDPQELSDVSSSGLDLIDAELAEHERWGSAAAKVGDAGSAERAIFVLGQLGGDQKLSTLGESAGEGFGKAVAVTAGTKVAAKVAEKVVEKAAVKLGTKLVTAGAKFSPLPAVGAVIGGVMAAYDLAGRDWKATGASLGQFGKGVDIYDTLANSIAAISTAIEVLSSVLTVIAGVIGAISLAMWAITVVTVGIASPLAASLSAIAGAIGLGTMILDAINAGILKRLIVVFRALHTFESEADPRDVVKQGAAVGEAANEAVGATGGFLAGMAGGHLAEHGMKGFEPKTPHAPVPDHPNPEAAEGKPATVIATPPEGGVPAGKGEAAAPNAGPMAVPVGAEPSSAGAVQAPAPAQAARAENALKTAAPLPEKAPTVAPEQPKPTKPEVVTPAPPKEAPAGPELRHMDMPEGPKPAPTAAEPPKPAVPEPVTAEPPKPHAEATAEAPKPEVAVKPEATAPTAEAEKPPAKPDKETVPAEGTAEKPKEVSAEVSPLGSPPEIGAPQPPAPPEAAAPHPGEPPKPEPASPPKPIEATEAPKPSAPKQVGPDLAKQLAEGKFKEIEAKAKREYDKSLEPAQKKHKEATDAADLKRATAEKLARDNREAALAANKPDAKVEDAQKVQTEAQGAQKRAELEAARSRDEALGKATTDEARKAVQREFEDKIAAAQKQHDDKISTIAPDVQTALKDWQERNAKAHSTYEQKMDKARGEHKTDLNAARNAMETAIEGPREAYDKEVAKAASELLLPDKGEVVFAAFAQMQERFTLSDEIPLHDQIRLADRQRPFEEAIAKATKPADIKAAKDAYKAELEKITVEADKIREVKSKYDRAVAEAKDTRPARVAERELQLAREEVANERQAAKREERQAQAVKERDQAVAAATTPDEVAAAQKKFEDTRNAIRDEVAGSQKRIRDAEQKLADAKDTKAVRDEVAEANKKYQDELQKIRKGPPPAPEPPIDVDHWNFDETPGKSFEPAKPIEMAMKPALQLGPNEKPRVTMGLLETHSRQAPGREGLFISEHTIPGQINKSMIPEWLYTYERDKTILIPKKVADFKTILGTGADATRIAEARNAVDSLRPLNMTEEFGKAVEQTHYAIDAAEVDRAASMFGQHAEEVRQAIEAAHADPKPTSGPELGKNGIPQNEAEAKAYLDALNDKLSQHKKLVETRDNVIQLEKKDPYKKTAREAKRQADIVAGQAELKKLTDSFNENKPIPATSEASSDGTSKPDPAPKPEPTGTDAAAPVGPVHAPPAPALTEASSAVVPADVLGTQPSAGASGPVSPTAPEATELVSKPPEAATAISGTTGAPLSADATGPAAPESVEPSEDSSTALSSEALPVSASATGPKEAPASVGVPGSESSLTPPVSTSTSEARKPIEEPAAPAEPAGAAREPKAPAVTSPASTSPEPVAPTAAKPQGPATPHAEEKAAEPDKPASEASKPVTEKVEEKRATPSAEQPKEKKPEEESDWHGAKPLLGGTGLGLIRSIPGLGDFHKQKKPGEPDPEAERRHETVKAMGLLDPKRVTKTEAAMLGGSLLLGGPATGMAAIAAKRFVEHAATGIGEGLHEAKKSPPIVERVNPHYQSPPCSPQDIVNIQNDILKTLEAREKAENVAGAMAGEEKRHQANEEPLTKVATKTGEAVDAKTAHENIVKRRAEANQNKQKSEQDVGAAANDYQSKSSGLGTLITGMKLFSRFTGLASSLPDSPDILQSAKSGILRLSGKTHEFTNKMEQANKAMEEQGQHQQVRMEAAKQDGETIKATDQKAKESGEKLTKTQDDTKTITKTNDDKKAEAAGLKNESTQAAGTLAGEAETKTAKSQSLAAALQTWAENHRKARQDAIAGTVEKYQNQGYTDVKVEGN